MPDVTQYQQMPYGGQPEPKKSKTLMIVLIILGSCLGLTVCCCGGCLFWASTLPEGGVQTANTMETYATDYLADNKLINTDETLVVYYDVTMSGTSEECYILTDQRLIHHTAQGDTIILLSDITDIRHREEFGDLITVQGAGNQYISLEIPPLNDGPLFLSALENQAALNGYGEEPGSNTDPDAEPNADERP